MRSAALPRFSSKIPGFISYVLLKSLILCMRSTRKIKDSKKYLKWDFENLGDFYKRISRYQERSVMPMKMGIHP